MVEAEHKITLLRQVREQLVVIDIVRQRLVWVKVPRDALDTRVDGREGGVGYLPKV